MPYIINRIIILIILILGTFTVKGQVNTSYRYTRFARNEQNKELYDTLNPYSFYNIIVQTIDRLTDGKNKFDYKGIQSSDIVQLRTDFGSDWRSISDLEMLLGPQARTPMSNHLGEDSILMLSDGSYSYLYPARDSIFFYFGEYSDIVLKERVLFDSITGKELVEPLEIYLRKQLFPNEEPTVVLSFNWELLYLIMKERYIPIDEKESRILIAAYEEFLAKAERRFDHEGCYQFIGGNNLFSYFNESEAINKLTDIDVVFNEWNSFKKANEEQGVFYKVISNETILVNEYGEDSLVFDPKLNDFVQVIRLDKDTLYYVKNQFESLYEYRCLYYDELRGWEEYLQAIIVTKKTPENNYSLSVSHILKYKTGLQDFS